MNWIENIVRRIKGLGNDQVFVLIIEDDVKCVSIDSQKIVKSLESWLDALDDSPGPEDIDEKAVRDCITIIKYQNGVQTMDLDAFEFAKGNYIPK